MITVEPMESAPAAVPTEARSFSVLVADDDPKLLQLLTRSLRLLRHRVVGSVATGQEAVVLDRQFQPELVILDIEMPGMSGIEAARAILQTREVPIIISTGRSDEAILSQFEDLPIAGYLVKPFSPAQLKAAIFVAMPRV